MMVDGRVPKEVWAVETEQQAADAVRAAAQRSAPLIPLGNGTKRHIGLPPAAYEIALWLRPLQGIVEYAPEDLTVTVRCGTTVAELQALLAEQNQFLPIDPPFPHQATIGGIIAANTTGPCRCLYGLVREHLLGVTVVQPDGTLTRFGGKVMKNVAGYDLTKLYVGSFGTLGVIVSATFKVRPIPEQRVTVPLWADQLERVEQFLVQLVLSDIAPAFAELVNASALQQLPIPAPAPYGLVLGFDGFREEVAWWLNETEKLVGAVGLVMGEVVEEDESIRSALRDFHAGQTAEWVLKALLPSSEVCPFINKAQKLLGESVAIIAHNLNGVVRLLTDAIPEPVTETVNELLRWACQANGNLIIEKAPMHLKPSLPIWGQPNNALTLMRRLKETLDPQRLFAPGRFV